MTKRREEVFTPGLEKRVMYMKGSSKQANVMVAELFGGLMEVGIKEISVTVFKVVGECFTVRVDTVNTRVTGTMVCLMEKELNISRMVNVIRVRLSKTSSMGRVFSLRTTQ